MPKVTPDLLSAVIITKNESVNLPKCLKSLQGVVDEIIVVDSYSTDNTEEICKNFDAKFIQKKWEGYAKTKNWANEQASYDHILSLDADEELSDELRQSILLAKESGSAAFAYKINRLTNYCGKWIRHCGWYPDIKPRLFDRREARWEGDFVHERLIGAPGTKWELLKGECHHYSYNSIAQHVQKINHFSTLAAQDRVSRGKKFSIFKLLFSPGAKFFSIYVFKLGFLDGTYGFCIAMISSWHNFLREMKMYGNKG